MGGVKKKIVDSERMALLGRMSGAARTVRAEEAKDNARELHVLKQQAIQLKSLEELASMQSTEELDLVRGLRNNPTFVQSAKRAILNILKGKPIVHDDGTKIFPSHSNMLAAAKLVFDRAEPAVKVSVATQILPQPVDLSRFLTSKIIDISAEELDS